MQQFFPVLFLCLSANIDTLLMSMCYGARQIRITFKYNVLIALISTLGTWISLVLGSCLKSYLPEWLPEFMGGILLLAIGIFVLLGFLLNSEKCEEPKYITIKTICCMAIMLTINNTGIGLAAGLAGYSIALCVILTFILTIVCIMAGNIAGKTLLKSVLGKYSELLSALLLICLGIYELL